MTTLYKDTIDYCTYGETIAVGQPLYKSTGTGADTGRTVGSVYLLDVTQADRRVYYGVAKEAGVATNTNKKVVIGGKAAGFTSLIAGSLLYAGATPGAITQTLPTSNILSLGLAENATTITVNTSLGGDYRPATLVDISSTQTVSNKTLAVLVQNETTDSTSTGSSAVLAAFSTGIVKLTNASLVSISGIPAGSAGQSLILENQLATAITLNNDDAGATAGTRIYTGSNANVSMAANSTFFFTYDTTTSHWRLTGGSGSGSGSGGINYILAPDAESGTTGWAAYSNTQSVTITNASPAVFTVTSTTGFYVGQPHVFTTSGTLPTGLTAGTTYYISSVLTGSTFKVSTTLGGADLNTSSAGSGTHTDRPLAPLNATGGSPVVTWTTSTSSPLRGTASFILTKDANDRAGEGVSYAFTIDSADKGKVLQGYVDYTVSSGTYLDNDVQFYIYDVTNAVVIQPAPFNLKSVTINDRMPFEFQTASNSTSYRLVMHVASASASAYTLKFDNFNVGPQAKLFGSAQTDWVAYTPVITGFGTVSLASFFWRRVGASIEIEGSFTSGTVAAALASFTLPNGASVDTAKISPVNNAGNPGMRVGAYTVSSSANYGSLTVNTGTSTSLVYFGNAPASSSLLTPANGNSIQVSGGGMAVNVSIPIAGLSSSQVFSADADTRVLSARYHGATATVTSSYSDVTFSTVETDTHSVYSGATATIPVPGKYAFTGQVFVAGTGALNNTVDIQLLKNGSTTIAEVQFVYAGAVTASVGIPFNFRGIDALAIDTFKIQVKSGATSPVISASNSENYLQIERATGPAQIAASESVNMRYYSSSSAISGSLATVTYATKDYDSHNAYSGGVFTVPTPGKYQVNAAILVTGTIALNNNMIIEIQKNGGVVSRFTEFFPATLTDGKAFLSDAIPCIATDTIRIQVSSSITGPSIVSSNFDNYVSIFRAGN